MVDFGIEYDLRRTHGIVFRKQQLGIELASFVAGLFGA